MDPHSLRDAEEIPKREKAFAKARETFGDVRVQISIKKLQLQPSKGESAKELMIRKMHRHDRQSSF